MRPLEGMKVAPFYGCYIVRPTSRLGYDEHPKRDQYLEFVIEVARRASRSPTPAATSAAASR